MNLDTNKTQLLKILEEDTTLCKDYLQQIAVEILDNDISKYPIFTATLLDSLEIGKRIIDKEEYDIEWSYYASHLEDFVNRGIISMDKTDAFREAYKDPRQFICLFVVFDENDMSFVFLPY